MNARRDGTLKAPPLRRALAVVLSALLSGGTAWGQGIPTLVNFQGRLTDSTFNPLTGAPNLTFSLYNVSAGGTPLWTETQNAVTVTNGVLSVQLGSVTPLPNDLFAGATLYLQVAVNGNPLTPRERFVATPYSFNSQLLQGQGADAFVSTGAVAQSIAGAKTFVGTLVLPPTLTLTGASSDPGGAAAGALYYNSASGKLRYHSGAGFVDIATGAITAASLNAVQRTGDSMTGDLAVGGSTVSAAGFLTLANLTSAPGAAAGRLYYDANGDGALKVRLNSGSFVSLSTGVSGSLSTVSSDAGQFSGTGALGSPLTLLSSSVTLQGNLFNAPNRLLKLDGTGAIPAAQLGSAVAKVGDQMSGDLLVGAATASTVSASGFINLAKLGATPGGAEGSIYYDTNLGGRLRLRQAAGWVDLATGSVAGAINYWDQSGSNISNNNAGNVGIGVGGPSAKLHVGGDAIVGTVTGTTISASGYINLPGLGSAPAGAAGRIYYDAATQHLRYHTGTSFVDVSTGGAGGGGVGDVQLASDQVFTGNNTFQKQVSVSTGTGATAGVNGVDSPSLVLRGQAWDTFAFGSAARQMTLKTQVTNESSWKLVVDRGLGPLFSVDQAGSALVFGSMTASGFFGDGGSLSGLNASNVSQGTLADARLPASLTGKTFTGAVSVAGSTLTVTGQDASGYSLKLSSGINMAGGTVTAGLFVGSGAGLTGVQATGVGAAGIGAGTLGAGVLVPVANLTSGPIPASLLVTTVAYTSSANVFTAGQSVTAPAGLAVTYGLAAGSATLTGGLLASSATLTQTGADYSLRASSGILVSGGAVTAPLFVGSGAGLTNVPVLAGNLTGVLPPSVLVGTVAYTDTYKVWTASQAYSAPGGLGVSYGLSAGSATLSGGLIASSATLTQTGTDYSLHTASGILVSGGAVTAPLFVGSGAGLTNVPVQAGNLTGVLPPSVLVGTVAYTDTYKVWTASQAYSAPGGLGVSYGLSAGSATLSGGLIASSATLTQTGADYSLHSASGVFVAAGSVTAPLFVGSGAGLTGVLASSVAATGVTPGTFAAGVLLPTANLSGILSPAALVSTVAYTDTYKVWTASQTHSAPGGLGVTYGLSAGSATLTGGLVAAGAALSGGLVASSATLTQVGADYSLRASSGILVSSGAVVAPYFVGDGSGLTNVNVSSSAAKTDTYSLWTASQTFGALGGLGVTYGLSAGSVTIASGLTASSATLTQTGADYSLRTSSGILVSSGSVSAPAFIGAQGLFSTAAVTGGLFSVGSSTLSVASGRVGVGVDGSSATYRLDVRADQATADVAATGYGTGMYGASILRSARGTQAVPTASQSGDTLGQLGFRGYGATGFASTDRAGVEGLAAETWTDAAQGAHASVFTTPVGTVTPLERIRVDSEGNVGIGVTAMTAKLQIGGTAGVDGIRFPDGTLMKSANIGNVSGLDTTSDAIINADNLSSGTGAVKLRTKGVDRAVITNSGQVGIGTSSPATTLNVIGSARMEVSAGVVSVQHHNADTPSDNATLNSPIERFVGVYDSNAGGGVTRAEQTADIQHIITAGGASPASRLAVSVPAASERLSILSSGLVGISNTAPTSTLDVGGSIGVSNVPIVTSTRTFQAADGATAGPAFSFASEQNTGLYRPGSGSLSVATAGVERLRVDTGGVTVSGSGNLNVVNGAIQISGNTVLTATRTYQANDGATTGAAFAFTAESNSGLYRVAPNTIGVTVGGTQRVQIDATGLTVTGTGGLNVANGAISIGGATVLTATRTYQANDGSTSGSGFAFVNETNSGMFRPGTGAVGFATQGSERGRFDSTGLTVTGGASMTGALTVAGSVAVSAGRLATLGDGSAPAPAYSFTSETNSGLFRPSANALGLAIGGVEKLRLDSNGLNLVTGDFQLGGSSVVTSGRLVRAGDGGVTGAGVAFLNEPGLGLYRPTVGALGLLSQGVERGRIDANGLTLQTGSNLNLTNGAVQVGGTNVVTSARLAQMADGAVGGPSYSFATDATLGMYKAAANNLSFATNGTQRGFFDNSGFTVAGTGNLNVANGAIQIGGNTVLTATRLYQSNDGSLATPGFGFLNESGGGGLYRQGAGAIGVVTAGTERMRFDTNGANLLSGDFYVNNSTMVTSGGLVRAQNGSATAPSYSWHAETDSGLYRSASRTLSMNVAGVERAKFDTTGFTVSGSGNLNVNGGAIQIGGVNVLTASRLYLGDNGAAATPAFSFNGDTNTGLYNAGADLLGFATGGVQRAQVDSTGLTVSGTGNLNVVGGAIQIGGTNVLTATRLYQGNDGAVGGPAFAFASEANSGLFRPAAQTVSIAVNGVQRASFTANGLTVTGNLDMQAPGSIRIAGVDAVTAARTFNAPTGTPALPGYSFTGETTTGLYDPGSNVLGLVTGGVERARVDSNGVGVATGTNASAALTVGGNGGRFEHQTAGSLALHVVNPANPADGSFLNSPLLRVSASNDTTAGAGVVRGDFSTDVQTVMTAAGAAPAGRMAVMIPTGSERLSVLSSGNVGVGTTSPQSALDIGAGAGTAAALSVGGTQVVSSTRSLRAGDGTAAAPGLTFHNDSSLGFFKSASGGGMGLAVGGVQVASVSAAGLYVSGVLNATSDIQLNGVSLITTGNIYRSGNGTTASPAYTFLTETGTGWSRPLAGQLSLSLTGAEAARMDSNGWNVITGDVLVNSVTRLTSAGLMRSADGSMVTPAFAFSTENGLGLYRAGAADLRLAAVGADLVRFTAANGVDVRSGGLLFNGVSVISSTRQVTVADGVLSAPGVNFSAEGNTGLYRPSSGVLGASVQGTERARFDSTGLLVTGNLRTNFGSSFQQGAFVTVTSSRTLNVTDGSATTPAYSYSNDTTLGVYRPTTGSLGTATAGYERLRVDATGFMGIGTTAPSSLIHERLSTSLTNVATTVLRLEHATSGSAAVGLGVGIGFSAQTNGQANRDVAQVDAIWTNAADASRTGALRFLTATVGAPVERMRIVDAAGVGIGVSTANPEGIATFYPSLTMGATGFNNASAVELQGNATNANTPVGVLAGRNVAIGAANNRIGQIDFRREGGNNSGSIVFQTANAGSVAERVKISSNGFVGIGTGNPLNAIHIGIANEGIRFADNTVLTSVAGLAAANIITSTDAVINADNDANGSGAVLLRVGVSGSSVAYLSNAGFFGVGTSSPAAQTHVRFSAESLTTGTSNLLRLERDTTGTPAAGYGTGLVFAAKSNGVANRDMGAIDTLWTNPADATRTAAMRFLTVSTGAVNATERMRIVDSIGLGIGVSTANPDSIATFYPSVTVGPMATGNSAALELQGNQTADGAVGVLVGHNTAAANPNRVAQIEFRRDGANNSGSIAFLTSVLSGTPTEKVRISTSGLVGIGTSNPTASLHIAQGGIRFPDNSLMTSANVGVQPNISVSTSAVITAANAGGSGDVLLRIGVAGSSVAVLGNSGNFGVGTSSPAALIHGRVLTGLTAATTIALRLEHDGANAAAGYGVGLAFAGRSATVGQREMGGIEMNWNSAADATRSSVMRFMTVSSGSAVPTERMRLVDTIGLAVGASTANPGNLTSFFPSVTVGPFATRNAAALELQGQATTAADQVGAVVGWNTNSGQNRLGQIDIRREGDNASGSIGFFTNNAGSFAERIRISSTGFLGIGTADPVNAIHIKTNGQGIRFPDGTLMTSAGVGSAAALTTVGNVVVQADSNTAGSGSIFLRTGLTDRVLVANNGYLGVGTSTPTSQGHVRLADTLSSGVTSLLRLEHDTTGGNGAAGMGSGLSLAAKTDTIPNRDQAQIDALWLDAADATRSSALRLHTVENGSLLERVRVSTGGFVGIGTSVPGSTLTVAGNIQMLGAGSSFIFGDGTSMNTALISSAATISNATDSTVSSDNDLNGTGQVTLRVSGVDRVVVSTGGLVGVGVASPIPQSTMTLGGGLSITGADASFTLGGRRGVVDFDPGNAALRLGAVNGGSGGAGGVVFLANGAEAGRFDANGRLGIGTTSPSSPLTVAGFIESTAGGVKFPDGTTLASANQLSGSVESGTDAVVQGDSDVNASGGVILRTGSSDRVTVTNAGLVGVGTANPADTFHVVGGARFQASQDSVGVQLHNGDTPANNTVLDSPVIRFVGVHDSDASGSVTRAEFPAEVQLVMTTPGASPAGRVSTSLNGVEVLSVLSNGSVGIGTTNPAAGTALDAAGSIAVNGLPVVTSTRQVQAADGSAANPSFTFSSNQNTGFYKSASNAISASAAGAERMRVDATGLTVTGNVNATGALQVGGTPIITSTRTYQAANGTAAGPAFTFSADQTSGLYDVSAGVLGVATAGTQRLQVDSSGLTVTGAGGLNVNNGAIMIGGSAVLTATRTYQANDGALSAPSFALVNETNTGVYRPTSGALGFVTQGVERGRFSALGLTVAQGALNVSNGGVTVGGVNVVTATRTLQANDGAVSAPAYAFSNETNTGLYRPGANAMGAVLGGVEKLRLDANGLNLITGDFQLGGSSVVTSGRLVRAADGSLSGAGLAFLNDPGVGLYRPSAGILGLMTAGVERGRFDATGLTVATGHNLNVANGAYQVGGTNVVTSARLAQMADGAVGGPSYSFATDSTLGMYKAGTNSLGFVTAGTQRGFFDNSGFTVSGTGNLNVANGAIQIAGSTVLTATRTYQANDGSLAAPSFALLNESGGGGLYRPAAGAMGLVTAGVERVRVDTSGTNVLTGDFYVANSTMITAGGLVRAQNGAVTAPSYSFHAETDSGLYRSASRVLSMVIAGVERAKADTTGFTVSGTGNLNVNGGALQLGGTTALTSTRLAQLANGAASGPAFSFSGDTDTGLFENGSDVLGFATGGTLRGQFDNTGLTVSGTGNLNVAGGAIQIGGVNVLTGTRLYQSADGAASGPGFAFASETNSGLFRPTAQTVSIAVNGIQRASFTATGVNILGNLDLNPAGALGVLKMNGVDTITNTRLLNVASGSPAAAAYAFTGDANTGLYEPGSGVLGVVTGGVERVRVDSNGIAVATGTNAAAALTVGGNGGRFEHQTAGSLALHVVNPATPSNESFLNSPLMRLSASNDSLVGAGVTRADYSTDFQTVMSGAGAGTGRLAVSVPTGSEKLSVLSSGNVGIGNTAPLNTLDVAGGIGVSNIMVVTSTRGFRAVDGTAALPAYSFAGDNTLGLFRNGSSLAFAIGGVQRASFTVTGLSVTGNVETNGVYALAGSTVVSSTRTVWMSNGSAPAPTYSFSGDLVSGMYLPGVGSLGFATAGTQRAQIDSSGLTVNSGNLNVSAGSIQIGGTTVLSSNRVYQAADGSAASPGFVFASDTTLGVFKPGSSTLGIATSGLERLRVDASGNVGVNQTAPTAILHVRSTDSVSGAVTSVFRVDHDLISGNSSAGMGSGMTFAGRTSVSNRDMAQVDSVWTNATDASRSAALRFLTTNNAASLAERMRIDNLGYVGISTAIPQRRLHVVETGAGFQIPLAIENGQAAAANVGPEMDFLASGGVQQAAIQGGWNGAATTDAYLALLTRGSGSLTERLRVTSGGHVGIGTTSPNFGGQSANSRVLTLSGTSTGAADVGALELRNPNATTGNSAGDVAFVLGNSSIAAVSVVSAGAADGGELLLKTRVPSGALTERMRVDRNGNVGIGSNAPTTKLYVAGGDIATSNGGSGLILKSPDGSTCRRLSIDNSGNLTTSFITCP